MKKRITIHLSELFYTVEYLRPSHTQLTEGELQSVAIDHLYKMMKSHEKSTYKIKNKQVFKVNSVEINELNSLTNHEISPGRIVRTVHNEYGIVTGVSCNNEKNRHISVVLHGPRIWYFTPKDLFSTSIPLEYVKTYRDRSFRSENLWHEGNAGYLQVNGEYKPIIIGKKNKSYTLIHTCHHETKAGQIFRIPTKNLNKYISEFSSDSEYKTHSNFNSDTLMKTFRIGGLERLKIQTEEQVAIFYNELFHLNIQLKKYMLENERAVFDKLQENFHSGFSKIPLEQRMILNWYNKRFGKIEGNDQTNWENPTTAANASLPTPYILPYNEEVPPLSN